jgi:uncharacterized membrane protein
MVMCPVFGFHILVVFVLVVAMFVLLVAIAGTQNSKGRYGRGH